MIKRNEREEEKGGGRENFVSNRRVNKALRRERASLCKVESKK